jgi:hypothetical protein
MVFVIIKITAIAMVGIHSKKLKGVMKCDIAEL